MDTKTKYFGTIIPANNFNASGDASLLRNAMKGMGTDEKVIINVATTRSNKQRQEIKVAFQRDYQRDLMKDLTSELSGHFRDVVLALFMLPEQFSASNLNHAIKGIGTSESTLVEILATSSNEEIKQINHFYQKDFNHVLATDIMGDTSADFRNLLIAMNAGSRDCTGKVNVAKAEEDARLLYAAGEKKLGTDEQAFVNVFTINSFAQLRQVFAEYEKVAKKDIVDSVKSEFSGDIKYGLLIIAAVARDVTTYFAQQLNKAMKGAGTSDHKLTRILVSRSEIDLAKIEQEYKTLFKQPLADAIAGDTSGDYKKVLLALLTR